MAVVVVPAWKLAKQRAAGGGVADTAAPAGPAGVNEVESSLPLTPLTPLTQERTCKMKDRHKPGYMMDYMRGYRKRKKAAIDSKA